MDQTGKLLNRKITPANTPPKLLSYRNADLMQEKNITERVLSIFKIKRDFVAVRIQNNQFTDLKNKKFKAIKTQLPVSWIGIIPKKMLWV